MRRVVFLETVYWFDGDLLAPLDHFTPSGDYVGGLHDVSFAVIEGSNIVRYGKIIGSVGDLVEVIDATAQPEAANLPEPSNPTPKNSGSSSVEGSGNGGAL